MNKKTNLVSDRPKDNYLTKKELIELIQSIKDMRDKLILKILYESGCSLNELVNIKVEDIFDQRISIENPDTKEKRLSRISNELYQEISSFIKGNNLSKGSYILSTKHSEKISEKRVRQLIQFYSKNNSKTIFNPQDLRYYHIAHAYLDGVYIETISSQLGIKPFRVFQILSELKITSNINHYDLF